MAAKHLRLKGRLVGNSGQTVRCGREVMTAELVVVQGGQNFWHKGLRIHLHHDGSWQLAVIDEIGGEGSMSMETTLAVGELDARKKQMVI